MRTVNFLWYAGITLIVVCTACAVKPKIIAEQENTKGIEFYQKGAYAAAQSHFENTLKAYPNNPDALYYTGLIHLRQNDPDKSIHFFSKAIEVNPEPSKAFSMRGTAYILKGDYNKAEKDLDLAISKDPKFLYSYVNRAVIYVMTGRFEKGIQECDFVLERQPENSNMLQAKSIALYNAGLIIPAVNSALKAVKSNSGWANPYFILGGYFHQIGKKDDAEKFFKTAYNRNSHIIEDMFNILQTPADEKIKKMHREFIQLAQQYLAVKEEDKINSFIEMLKKTGANE